MKIQLLANDFMKGEKFESDYHREITIGQSSLTFIGESVQVFFGITNPSHEEVIEDLFISPDTATFIAHCLMKQAALCERKNIVNQLEIFTTNKL